jgi:hypothetical protein
MGPIGHLKDKLNVDSRSITQLKQSLPQGLKHISVSQLSECTELGNSAVVTIANACLSEYEESDLISIEKIKAFCDVFK